MIFYFLVNDVNKIHFPIGSNWFVDSKNNNDQIYQDSSFLWRKGKFSPVDFKTYWRSSLYYEVVLYRAYLAVHIFICLYFLCLFFFILKFASTPMILFYFFLLLLLLLLLFFLLKNLCNYYSLLYDIVIPRLPLFGFNTYQHILLLTFTSMCVLMYIFYLIIIS